MENTPLSEESVKQILANNPKAGKPRTWTEEALRTAVTESTSMRSCLKRLQLKPTGGNYKSIQSHIDRLNLDTSHWTGQGWLAGTNIRTGPIRELDEILIKDSTYTNTSSLKRRLVETGLLTYECVICGIWEWNEKPLVLQLDHINGINNDHRLENLQLICPNCDSQQDTFRGRNKNAQKHKDDEELLRKLGLLD